MSIFLCANPPPACMHSLWGALTFVLFILFTRFSTLCRRFLTCVSFTQYAGEAKERLQCDENDSMAKVERRMAEVEKAEQFNKSKSEEIRKREVDLDERLVLWKTDCRKLSRDQEALHEESERFVKWI